MFQGVTNTTQVTYVVVTRTRELGDLLAEGERGEESKTKPRKAFAHYKGQGYVHFGCVYLQNCNRQDKYCYIH